MKNRIKIDDRADRETVALILFRNGYTIRPVKIKTAGSSKFDYFVEYENKNETLGG